jgi:hypothetical protein
VWTHEFGLGGTVFFDRNRSFAFSALASYELNGRNAQIDLTRGDTVNLQGGLGKRFWIVNAGIAAYALWQVRDDRGSGVPPSLVGARDQVYGLGPEIDVLIPPMRSTLTFRYEHDVAVWSRPFGQVFVVELTGTPWKPKARAAPTAPR